MVLFSCGYVRQQDGACGIPHIVGSSAHVLSSEKNVSPRATAQQWTSMAQRNKLYQAWATQTVFVSRINSVLELAFHWDLLSVRYHQTGHLIYSDQMSVSLNPKILYGAV